MARAEEEAEPNLSSVCEALQALASENGEVTQEDLCKTLGENVQNLIEEKLGCGPWHMNQLEHLVVSLGSAEAMTKDQESTCVPEAATEADAKQDADEAAADASEESGHPSEWRTQELGRLHNLLANILNKSENADAVDFMEDEAEFDALKIQRDVMRHVVMPLRTSPMNPSGGAEVLWKARMQQLPRVVDELGSLLQKSLRLVYIHGTQNQKLRSLLQDKSEEMRQKQDEAEMERRKRIEVEGQAGHDEQAQTLLETTIQRLNGARQSVREKDQELAELRQHVELLFAERARQDELVQKLEAQVQQAHAARSEEKSMEDEGSEAALLAQRSNGDLRRRLSAAELALDDARQCFDRLDGASAEKDRRIAELEAHLKELEQEISTGQPRPCMRRSYSALESLGGTHTPRADDSAGSLQASLAKGVRGRRSLPGWSLSGRVEDCQYKQKAAIPLLTVAQISQNSS
jgi:hypothetical protein